MSAFVRYANPRGGQDAFYVATSMTSWHTATIEWSPGKVVFFLDGAVVGTSTSEVPSNPMHCVLQTETQLAGGAPSSSAAGHVRIAWAAAYTYVPQSASRQQQPAPRVRSTRVAGCCGVTLLARPAPGPGWIRVSHRRGRRRVPSAQACEGVA